MNAAAFVTDITVVIATRDRPRLLERCLLALVRQTYAPARYEIVVVDDGIDPGTRHCVDAIREWGAPRLRLLASSGRGPAAARNRGWRSSTSELIAFTDDDTVPANDWLREGHAAMDQNLVAVSGRVVVPLPPAPTDYERDAAGLASAAFVTANCFVRRRALEAIGGFDERYPCAWREDSDLHFSLLSQGGRIGRAEAATVLHPVRPASWGISLRQQRKVMFDALLYRKHPQFYRRYIRAHARWDYYLLVALLLGGLVALVLQANTIASAALAAWIVLTLAMTRRRLRGTSRHPWHRLEMLLTSAAIPPLAVFWRLIGAIRYRVLFL